MSHRMAGRIAGLACAFGLLAAAPAVAAPVALLDAPRAQSVALAGDEVIVARVRPRGAVAVDAVRLADGSVRRILAAPARGRGWTAQVRVAASAERVAVLAHFDADEGDPGGWRLYNGPPAGPLRLDRTGRGSAAWLPAEIDVDGDRLLLMEGHIPTYRWRATVLAPGAPPERVPWSAELLPPTALAGDRIAFADSPRRGRGARVFVADRRSGEVAASLTLPGAGFVEAIDLSPAGHVVAAADGRLLTFGPGTPQAVVPGGDMFSFPRFAGERIAALEEARFDAHRPVLLDPRQPLGAPSTAFRAFAADARGVAWIANGCVLYAALSGPAAAGPAGGRCPAAEVRVEEGDQILRGRRLRVSVTCVAAPASGCRGTVILRRGGRVAGRGRFELRAGTRRTAEVVLTRRAARRVRSTVRRDGDASLRVGARVDDGRVPGSAGRIVVIDRVAR